MPLVSIITPSFNQADFLEQTILSVLSQDHPNIEYIIIDGGSTDGSVEIIQKYADRLAYWVSEPDKGQADAINKGFARATGEIVAWLNSDDLYAPGAVTQAVQVFAIHPEAGMIFGNAVSIDEKGRPMNDMIFADWGLEGLVEFNIICQPAVFMRKDALRKAGALDTDLHFLLDHHLWLRVAQQAPAKHIPKLWAFARHHPAAKNVALSAGFGVEAQKLLAWMRTQPTLNTLVERRPKQVAASVHRFDARYLLDGNQPWAALKAYSKAFLSHPPTALKEWHRMLFAALSLIGLKKLGKIYYRMKKQKRPASMEGVENVDLLYKETG